MSDLLAAVFWVSAGAVVYAYIGYPLFLAICSRLFGRRHMSDALDDRRLPFVSVLVAAHNEEAVIAERLANLLGIDYPADRIEIVIASDGSEDRTGDIVRACTDPRVRLLDYRFRRGKAAVLNEAFQNLRGEIVLLSDANTMMDAQAARLLARWFVNPDVGVVSGRLILIDPETGGNGDGLYWKYETFLKQHESRLGALLGANGAIYAIRRSAFTGIRANTAVDDFVIPLLARIRSGCRLLYDDQALAIEETPAEIRAEFRRRSRIGAGGFQSLATLRPLLHPSQGWIAFTFWSHKVLRWTCPFFMLGALASSFALAGEHLIYLLALLAQLSAYAAALVGHWIPGQDSITARIARLTTLFASMNAALLVGFFMWASGRQGGVWERTARVRPGGPLVL